mgnify:CR=1 FL=1
MSQLENSFSLAERVAVVTGGTGVLGGAMAQGLALAGARVGILGRRRERAEAVVAQIAAAGGQAIALVADVLARGDSFGDDPPRGGEDRSLPRLDLRIVDMRRQPT